MFAWCNAGQCRAAQSGADLIWTRQNIPNSLDLLLAVDVFWEVLCIGQIKASHNNPFIQKPYVRWGLVGGNEKNMNNQSYYNFILSSVQSSIHDCIQRFWQLDGNLFKKIQSSLIGLENNFSILQLVRMNLPDSDQNQIQI